MEENERVVSAAGLAETEDTNGDSAADGADAVEPDDDGDAPSAPEEDE
jgi:hypothetical protein